MKAVDQYYCLVYELAGVAFCLLDLVIWNDVIPVREDLRGLLHELPVQDLPLRSVAPCKFLEQFGSNFSVGSDQAAQQFYVTAMKAIRAVARQVDWAMSGFMDQFLHIASLQPTLICDGNWYKLTNSIIILAGLLSMRGMVSARELETLGSQYLNFRRSRSKACRRKCGNPLLQICVASSWTGTGGGSSQSFIKWCKS